MSSGKMASGRVGLAHGAFQLGLLKRGLGRFAGASRGPHLPSLSGLSVPLVDASAILVIGSRGRHGTCKAARILIQTEREFVDSRRGCRDLLPPQGALVDPITSLASSSYCLRHLLICALTPFVCAGLPTMRRGGLVECLPTAISELVAGATWELAKLEVVLLYDSVFQNSALAQFPSLLSGCQPGAERLDLGLLSARLNASSAEPGITSTPGLVSAPAPNPTPAPVPALPLSPTSWMAEWNALMMAALLAQAAPPETSAGLMQSSPPTSSCPQAGPSSPLPPRYFDSNPVTTFVTTSAPFASTLTPPQVDIPTPRNVAQVKISSSHHSPPDQSFNLATMRPEFTVFPSSLTETAMASAAYEPAVIVARPAIKLKLDPSTGISGIGESGGQGLSLPGQQLPVKTYWPNDCDRNRRKGKRMMGPGYFTVVHLPFRCSSCRSEFWTSGRLYSHYKSSHPSLVPADLPQLQYLRKRPVRVLSGKVGAVASSSLQRCSILTLRARRVCLLAFERRHMMALGRDHGSMSRGGGFTPSVCDAVHTENKNSVFSREQSVSGLKGYLDLRLPEKRDPFTESTDSLYSGAADFAADVLTSYLAGPTVASASASNQAGPRGGSRSEEMALDLSLHGGHSAAGTADEKMPLLQPAFAPTGLPSGFPLHCPPLPDRVSLSNGLTAWLSAAAASAAAAASCSIASSSASPSSSSSSSSSSSASYSSFSSLLSALGTNDPALSCSQAVVTTTGKACFGVTAPLDLMARPPSQIGRPHSLLLPPAGAATCVHPLFTFGQLAAGWSPRLGTQLGRFTEIDAQPVSISSPVDPNHLPPLLPCPAQLASTSTSTSTSSSAQTRSSTAEARASTVSLVSVDRPSPPGCHVTSGREAMFLPLSSHDARRPQSQTVSERGRRSAAGVASAKPPGVPGNLAALAVAAAAAFINAPSSADLMLGCHARAPLSGAAASAAAAGTRMPRLPPPLRKKNSYKDAPKLITCPISGCNQKFPWNSSLKRHILTHTRRIRPQRLPDARPTVGSVVMRRAAYLIRCYTNFDFRAKSEASIFGKSRPSDAIRRKKCRFQYHLTDQHRAGVGAARVVLSVPPGFSSRSNSRLGEMCSRLVGDRSRSAVDECCLNCTPKT
ncbi:unnamed protein product [Protopolystoma xenopodis]|uniref:C2H2-type domain-containing protein n=1 Tax=Protopolystoma xenopodis TaxID=117903 RepID=A0A3S5A4K7_9PLAT|nr:unnamed protein product [Protopolystoma xenopodis]